MALCPRRNREWVDPGIGEGYEKGRTALVWKGIRRWILPSRPPIPETALAYAPFEHQHDSRWVAGWLFLDDTGFGFVSQIIAEPLFHVPYSSLIRYNYNRLHHRSTPLDGRPRKRVRDLCFLRFHIDDPHMRTRCLDFRGELESIQALDGDLRKRAYGELD